MALIARAPMLGHVRVGARGRKRGRLRSAEAIRVRPKATAFGKANDARGPEITGHGGAKRTGSDGGGKQREQFRERLPN